MKITFFGAAQEVTGSRYLIEHNNTKILVDCGLFQGPWHIARRNLDPFPVDPASIDAIVVTHAHVDHIGYIPALVKNGFSGPVYCSKGTHALSAVLLVDSGLLQEERAKRSEKEADPDHPPRPALYTVQDAQHALAFFKPVEYDHTITIGSLRATLIRSGHILGSAFVVISDGTRTLTFSGDLGRPQQFIMKSPPALKNTDYLVLESTYGHKMHGQSSAAKITDSIEAIGDVVNATVKKGGVLIIPCFAVGRTEEILYCLYQLRQRNAIPQIPIFLDSPMAIKIAEFFCDYMEEYIISPTFCRSMFQIATYTRTIEESKQLNELTSPAIIIAGSGMADGGRIPFHFQHFVSDPKNTILFVGFQVQGTSGEALTRGIQKIKIQGEMYTVKAEVKKIETLSAHADYNEILAWLAHFENKPKKVFVTHGEPASSQALKEKVEQQFGWSVMIPKYGDSFELS
jgi:metallo-beta-lactamase family protein